MDRKTLLELTADIVAAHASNSELSQEDLLSEIHKVFSKLAALDGETDVTADFPTLQRHSSKPAVPLDAAFAADKVFCMVCGKSMKTLKRHLAAAHGLKPGQYRKLFGIPSKTPLVAREYSEKRKVAAQKNDLAQVLAKAREARTSAKEAANKSKTAARSSTGKTSSRKPAKAKA